MIDKLEALNTDRRVVRWIAEFLKERVQCVKLDNTYSRDIPVTSGVIQGSAIGPLLYLIYINDLPNVLKCMVRLFADDAIIYRIISNIRDCEILQNDLHALFGWCESNGALINTSKCKHISFAINRSNVLEYDYDINNVFVPHSDQVKYLGVLLSNDLTWNLHINNIVCKANKNLHFVMRNLKFASRNTKSLAYKTLIRPILEYSSAVWDPYQNYLVNKIEGVQRKAARYVCNQHSRHDSVKCMIQELEWPSLSDRRIIARLSMFFKIYNNFSAYRDLHSELHSANYIGRHDHACKVSEISASSDREKYSLIPRTIKDWNSLPSSICDELPHSHKKFISLLRDIYSGNA